MFEAIGVPFDSVVRYEWVNFTAILHCGLANGITLNPQMGIAERVMRTHTNPVDAIS